MALEGEVTTLELIRQHLLNDFGSMDSFINSLNNFPKKETTNNDDYCEEANHSFEFQTKPNTSVNTGGHYSKPSSLIQCRPSINVAIPLPNSSVSVKVPAMSSSASDNAPAGRYYRSLELFSTTGANNNRSKNRPPEKEKKRERQHLRDKQL
ncbi:ethylene-responsive transcription factor 5-like [Cannabis sativa]|uniref:ethylene-responsive transcription factor 5-like n=1 Tax=Cannabis sativa TaxID=3483 RepID=UPI0029CA7DC0|nr:ethylene-responsive transcription factor 5-like [Cannabis sativa]